MSAAVKYPPIEKKPNYAPTGTEPGYDGHPTVEQEVRDIEGQGKRVLTIRRRVSWLDRMEREGFIEDIHLDAGNKLRDAWEGTQISGAGVSWDNFGASRQPYMGLSDGTCRSIDLFGDAWASVPQRCRPILGHMVLDNHSKDHASMFLRIDRRAVLPYLLVGLDALAEHYGLKFTAPLVIPGRKW